MAANTVKLTSTQEQELNAFMRRLPPDLVPYSKDIRAWTIPMFKERSDEEYVKNFLASSLAIEQLQMLRDSFDALCTDGEFDAGIVK